MATIRALVAAAALAHGVNVAVLDHMAYCESTYRPHAVNEPNLGLFQLSRYGKLPDFQAWELRQGFDTDDPFDPARQANYVADALLAGQGPAWACFPRWLRLVL